MNTNGIAKHYGKLSPEESFRVILAAGMRNDKAESDRVVRAEQRIVLSFPAHAPYGDAFHEILLMTHIELLEDAAFYQECNDRFNEQFCNCIEAHLENDALEFPAWNRAERLVRGVGY